MSGRDSNYLLFCAKRQNFSARVRRNVVLKRLPTGYLFFSKAKFTIVLRRLMHLASLDSSKCIAEVYHIIDGNKQVGRIAVFTPISRRVKMALDSTAALEVSIFISENNRNKGYCSEAVWQICNMYSEHQSYALVRETNNASVACFHKMFSTVLKVTRRKTIAGATYQRCEA